MKNVLAFATLLVASFGASAATYNLTPVNYTATTPFTVCFIGTCANFSTAMQVTATFETAAPLPPNLPGVDISGLITSGSASNGLRNFTSTDPSLRVLQFDVATDNRGIIIAYSIQLERWQTPGAVHVVGDRFDYVSITSAGVTGIQNIGCTTIGVGAGGQPDTCTTAPLDTATSIATGPAGPGFIAAAVLNGIPTLGEWALILLASLMAGVGMLGLRRGARAA